MEQVYSVKIYVPTKLCILPIQKFWKFFIAMSFVLLRRVGKLFTISMVMQYNLLLKNYNIWARIFKNPCFASQTTHRFAAYVTSGCTQLHVCMLLGTCYRYRYSINRMSENPHRSLICLTTATWMCLITLPD